MSNRIGDKNQALLARKTELLNEIKYYEKRIGDARNNNKNNSYFDDESSDSEQEFSVDIGPSITELKLQQNMLGTCLQAMQELTNVMVLQSEVNVLTDEPVFEREPPVSEDGVWREVTVECRVDLVPFSMTFYAHQPNRMFGPISYRNLQVTPVKSAHEIELSKSVLPGLKKPSDSVEVLRSYASAHRSRRSTLARLAEKYADSLFMEPMPEGGYVLKCANLLEVSWTLQNKWSPIAPFHHRMKFDLEYMDESYIKIITAAHRQLSDPSVDTDERTMLLAKIINTCLEAQGPTQELYESMESDPESQKLRRRQTLDQEIDAPGVKSKDSQIMAPPKSLPKKIKPKGKENNVENNDKQAGKSVKRSNDIDNSVASKKAKIDANNIKNNESDTLKSKISSKNTNLKPNRSEDLNKKTDDAQGDNVKVVESNTKSVDNKENDQPKQSTNKKAGDNVKNSNDDPKNKQNRESKANDGNNPKSINVEDKAAKSKSNKEKDVPANKKSKQSVHKDTVKSKKDVDDAKSIKNVKNTTDDIKPKNDKGNKGLKTNKEKNPPQSSADLAQNDPSKLKAKKIDTAKNNDQEKHLRTEKSNNKTNELKNDNQIPTTDKPKTSKTKPKAVESKTVDEPKNLKTKLKSAESTSNIKKPKMSHVLEKKNIINPKNVKDSEDPKLKENVPQVKNKNTNTASVKNKNEVKTKPINNTKNSNNINKDVQKSTNNIKNKQGNLADRFPKNYNINRNSVASIKQPSELEESNKKNTTNIKTKDTQIPKNFINNTNNTDNNTKIKKSLNSLDIKMKNIHNQKAKKSLGVITKAISKPSSAEHKKKVTKIPLKKLPISENSKKNPLRMSPRKPQPKLSFGNDSSKNSTRSLQKQITNIPRLLKNPSLKPKS